MRTLDFPLLLFSRWQSPTDRSIATAVRLHFLPKQQFELPLFGSIMAGKSDILSQRDKEVEEEEDDEEEEVEEKEEEEGEEEEKKEEGEGRRKRRKMR